MSSKSLSFTCPLSELRECFIPDSTKPDLFNFELVRQLEFKFQLTPDKSTPEDLDAALDLLSDESGEANVSTPVVEITGNWTESIYQSLVELFVEQFPDVETVTVTVELLELPANIVKMIYYYFHLDHIYHELAEIRAQVNLMPASEFREQLKRESQLARVKAHMTELKLELFYPQLVELLPETDDPTELLFELLERLSSRQVTETSDSVDSDKPTLFESLYTTTAIIVFETLDHQERHYDICHWKVLNLALLQAYHGDTNNPLVFIRALANDKLEGASSYLSCLCRTSSFAGIDTSAKSFDMSKVFTLMTDKNQLLTRLVGITNVNGNDTSELVTAQEQLNRVFQKAPPLIIKPGEFKTEDLADMMGWTFEVVKNLLTERNSEADVASLEKLDRTKTILTSSCNSTSDLARNFSGALKEFFPLLSSGSEASEPDSIVPDELANDL